VLKGAEMNHFFFEFISSALSVTGLGYAIIIALLHHALKKVRFGQSDEQPFVSVIVAARNEEESIERCLDALLHQDYPADRYEVIVADDRSTDRTPEILTAYSGRQKQLTVIRIDMTPEGYAPKKHALASAIGHARGEIILQTDADCVTPPTWISGMVRRFEPEVMFVAGAAPYERHPGMRSGFTTHEYFWNILLSAGSIILGRGTHASGRNMGFRRSAFDAVDGYGDSSSVLSGDDTLLMQRFQRRFPGGVVTNPDPATHVYTTPAPSLRMFIRQRIRHMSTVTRFHPIQIAAGGIVYGFHLSLLGVCIGSFFSTNYLGNFVCAYAWKVFWDVLAFMRVHRVFRLSPKWILFLWNELLMVFYLSLVPILGVIIPVKWKENS
jgi:cellulose synthase/poly-beta-1,6-N-acetylglucosamine synthase-like glycosyltransferase